MFARLRPLYNQIVMPFGRLSLRLGLTPDFWTLFSLAVAAAASYTIFRGLFWLSLALIIVVNIADMLDGATARAGGTSSKFGTVLDHVVDRYAEFFIMGGLLVGGWISPANILFGASGVIMASYVRAKAESAGGVSECTVGIAGRQEKLFLMMGALVLLAFRLSTPAEICIFVMGLLSHITAVQRLLYARTQILKPKLQDMH